MKNEEIRSLSDDELVERVKVARNNLETLLFEHSISPLKNPNEIGQAKKLIARILTELQSRNIRIVKEKASTGEVNADNLREFQADDENGLLSPMKLSKMKRFAGIEKGTRV